MYICEDSLDDLMNAVLKALLSSQNRITPSRGPATEICGVLLELTNPRARLSRTEKKGKLFSSLGEFLWYLSKSNKLDFIEYYIRDYKEFSDDGKTIHGGYGRRLFNMRGQNQIQNVIDLLKKRKDSRQAVIQLFDASDLEQKYKDIPCTCTLQFLIRNGRLDLLVSMRSNDAFWGLPHDIFAFTMMQEIMARSLDVEVGSYKHVVGSLHLYDEKRASAEEYVKEGFQPNVPMPMLPAGDPWPSIQTVLQAELKIRRKKSNSLTADSLDPFWFDFVILLEIFARIKEKRTSEIASLRKQLSCKTYNMYIDLRQARLSAINSVKKTAAVQG